MKNKTTFIRDKGESFTVIPNRVLDDKRLTSDSQIIFIHIIRNSDDWVINKNDIMKRVNLPHHAFRHGWTLLKKYNYIMVIRKQSHVHYIIDENPNRYTGDPNGSPKQIDNETQDTGIRDKGDPLIITNKNKNQTKDPKTKGPTPKDLAGGGDAEKTFKSGLLGDLLNDLDLDLKQDEPI